MTRPGPGPAWYDGTWHPRPPTKLAAVRARPVKAVVDAVAKLTGLAESGQLRGLVVWCNLGAEVTFYHVGEASLTDVSAAVDDWKFCQLAHRNLERA